MIQDGTVRSTCDLCARGCGVLIHMLDGKPVKVEGDPQSHVNEGVLCIKGLASLEYLYHPDRLKYPLKRAGQRGIGRWERATWNEALDLVAGGLNKVKSKYGAESVAFIHGAAKGYGDSYLARLANVFGSPNVAWQGHVCAIPRWLGSEFTNGFNPSPDYGYPPACIFIWASNAAATLIYNHKKLNDALLRGTKLVVIDPRPIPLTQKADLWLRVRPGTDLALALGMIHVILEENLFDRDFVEKWTVGFERLQEHIRPYTPEKMADMTWIPAENIRETARFYAHHRPACIEDGNGLDHNLNSFQAARAISILRAITGNLGVPGGEAQPSPVPVLRRKSAELELWDKLPQEVLQRRVDAGLHLLPNSRFVTPESIWRAVQEDDPYPIRAAYVQGCNPLLTHSNARYTYNAMNKLDFLAVADMFMTPSAALADVVLPAASYLEYDSISIMGGIHVQQKVAHIGECRSNYDTLKELAGVLGLGDSFWDTEEQCLDAILKPSGITFRELRKIGRIHGGRVYRKYLSTGFPTPSGKVEIYSERLKEWGFDPLPVYRELPETPYSAVGLEKEFPLIFTTWKSASYRHAGGRQIATLRGAHPEPILGIHPQTAARAGIEEGDWVYIETSRGKIKQKAVLAEHLDSRIVAADYGWWFPEKGISDLYGWSESNINILTDNHPPLSPEMGSTNLRGIACRIYKAP
ncbi:MAG: molybdopterin-dependent oxidoreductase [Deltaproteobacteria bacterium]|nr:molybdopterin-dependent oxidoreductase [Deltaproteobacteria bacterium]